MRIFSSDGKFGEGEYGFADAARVAVARPGMDRFHDLADIFG
jgi:hypothetical protein